MINQTFNQKRDTTVSDKFINYFYDHCCIELFKPLLELPDITPDAGEWGRSLLVAGADTS